ncbi:MAG TPA: DMT family transporter [Candidatus Acidoferrales bacterium]|nr:DMT family transporter [Candidatus Acidoferrales bacterium]
MASLSPFAAMAAAVTLGVADFTGGRAGRRTSAPSAAIGIELVGLIVLPFAVLLLPRGIDGLAALQGFAGGAVGGLGLIAFYRAMALNLIGVVAPITGFVAAALPVAVGLIGGDHLGAWQLAGIALGLVGLLLVTGAGSETAKNARRGVLLALLAGVTFGLFFILFHAASRAGVTAFLSGRLGSSFAAFLAAIVSGTSIAIRRPAWRLIAFGGVLDGVGVVLFLYATHTGLLSISAVLTSFYPAFTVLCARFLTHERLTRLQALGAVMAVVAIALIAVT